MRRKARKTPVRVCCCGYSPRQDGRTAAVEFAVAEGEAATFLYRYTEDFGPLSARSTGRLGPSALARAVWIQDTDLASGKRII